MISTSWPDVGAVVAPPILLELQFDSFPDDCLEDSESRIGRFSDELHISGDNDSIGLSQSDDLSSHHWQDSIMFHEEAVTKSADSVPLQDGLGLPTTVELVPKPKIMKNDIRRHMARMFMNTVNSADLAKIQSFLRTFVVGPCMFVAQHEARPELRLPDKLITAGPRLMSHYLLGCFVQYPDMVMHMKNSTIVTSTRWSGYRVVMDIDICATKLQELDFGDWMPPAAQLCGMYRCAAEATAGVGRLTKPEAKKRRRAAAVACGATQGNHRIVLPDSFHATVSELADSDSIMRNQEPVLEDVDSVGVKIEGQSGKAKQRGARRRRSKATIDTDADIPDAFVHALFSKARPIPDPMDLLIRGTMIMFLDEGNHVQHLSLEMKQVDKEDERRGDLKK